MKKWFKKVLSLALTLAMLIPANTFAVNGSIDSNTKTNVDKVISYANQLRNANTAGKTSGGYTWDTESKKYSWAYFNGLMLDAFGEIGTSSDLSFIDSFYNANIGSTGNIVNFTTSTKASTGALDSVEPIRAVFNVLKTSSNASKYKKGIQTIYTMLENQITYSNCGGNYAHKQDSTTTVSSSWSTYPIALDGIYMAQPFLMECANAIDEGILTLTSKSGSTVTSSSIYSAVYNRFVWIYNNLYDSNSHLYMHAYNPSTGQTNGVAWSRSIGWYCMALVDTISMMPTGTYKTNLISELPRIFNGLLEYQDNTTGMWYNLPTYNSSLSKNELETSGTSMFAYAMIKAYQNGYVSDSKYYDAGVKAFNGVVNNKMTGSQGNYSVTGTYLKSGAGTTTSYYTQYSYTTNEAKGVGALILTAALLNKSTVGCNHTVVVDEAVAPTCTTTGLTQGSHCSVCNEVLVTQEVVAALGHSEVVDQAKEATCTTTGLTQGSHCSVCNTVITAQQVIPAKGHTEVIDEAVEATCTTNGLTEGKHCATCNTVITAQKEVPALGHEYQSVVTKEASSEEDGIITYTCSRCNDSYTEVIPALGNTYITYELATTIDPNEQYIVASGNSGTVNILGHNNYDALNTTATINGNQILLANGTDEGYYLWNFADTTDTKVFNDYTEQGRYLEVWSKYTTDLFGDNGAKFTIYNQGDGVFRIFRSFTTTYTTSTIYGRTTRTETTKCYVTAEGTISKTTTDLYLFKRVVNENPSTPDTGDSGSTTTPTNPDPGDSGEITTPEVEEPTTYYELANTIESGATYVIATGNSGKVTILGSKSDASTRTKKVDVSNGRINIDDVEQEYTWNINESSNNILTITNKKYTNIYVTTNGSELNYWTGGQYYINYGYGRYKIYIGNTWWMPYLSADGTYNVAIDLNGVSSVYLYKLITA